MATAGCEEEGKWTGDIAAAGIGGTASPGTVQRGLPIGRWLGQRVADALIALLYQPLAKARACTAIVKHQARCESRTRGITEFSKSAEIIAID